MSLVVKKLPLIRFSKLFKTLQLTKDTNLENRTTINNNLSRLMDEYYRNLPPEVKEERDKLLEEYKDHMLPEVEYSDEFYKAVEEYKMTLTEEDLEDMNDRYLRSRGDRD